MSTNKSRVFWSQVRLHGVVGVAKEWVVGDGMTHAIAGHHPLIIDGNGEPIAIGLVKFK